MTAMRKRMLQNFWELFREQVIRRKFVQDVGFLTVANVAGSGLSFIQALLVARWLGPEQFGTAALVMSYPALLFTVLDARSRDATVKYLTEFSARGETRQALAMCKLGYSIDLFIAVVAFLLVGMTAWWAEASIVQTPGVASLILVYALAFLPRSLVGTSQAVLSACGRFRTLAWIELLTTTFRVVVVLGLVLGGWGVAGVVWGSAVGMVVFGGAIGAVAYTLTRNTWDASWLSARCSHLRAQGREIFRFLFFTDLSGLMALFVKQVDIVILGYFRGPQEAGYYRLAKSLASVMTFAISPLQTVTYQRMVSLSNHPLKLRELTRTVGLRIGVPLGLINLVGIFLFPWFALRFAGQSYHPSVPAIQLWVIAYSVWFGCFWLRPFYLARGWTKQWFYLSVTGLLIFAAASVPSVTRWGFVGLTAARISFPVVVNVGGLVLLFVLFQDALKAKWFTKAGTGIAIEKVGKKNAKILEVTSRQHADFITSVISHERLSQYFPQVLGRDRGNVLTLEWVKGKYREKTTEEMVSRIANFQAVLHTCDFNGTPAGFDYSSFIVQRVSSQLDRIPMTARGPVERLMRLVETRQSTGGERISSPDVTPRNLIWSGSNFKVVDVELLNLSRFYPIDLFGTVHAFDLRGRNAYHYIECYKSAGGDVGGLRPLWDNVVALWLLRGIGAALESGDEQRIRIALEHALILRSGDSNYCQRDLREAINRCA